MRTDGGLLIQPFLDENNNGIRDSGESTVREDLDLLLSINNQNLSRYRPDASKGGALVTLSPDTYRIDLDPSGYSLNWQTDERAYAVSVVAGQYTPVEIPFTRAYTLIGMVLNEEDNALAGQRVEAIETSSDRRQSSVTNAAGVFYLEGLSAGDYRFEIGGKSAENEIITLDRTAEESQETNFRIMPTGIEVQRILPETSLPVSM
ncbi:MAG: carboxypeptidase-like regulatory domain-containing protein [Phormidesmis sp.]